MLRYLYEKTAKPRRKSSRYGTGHIHYLDVGSAERELLPSTSESQTGDNFGSGTSSPVPSEAPWIYSEPLEVFDERFPLISTPQCKICMDLDVRGSRLRIAFSELANLLLSGCSACMLLYDILKPWESVMNGVMDPSFYLRGDEIGLSIMRIGFPRIDEHVVLQSVEGYPSPWPSIPERCMSRSIRNIDSAVRTISRWLKVCESSHACGQGSTRTPLPKRVLEIQAPNRVRLHLSAMDEVGVYICLSHCWGGVVPLRLTSSTIEQFQKEILWRDLPATFQHAVQVAEKLAIRYLWIDSLCILQDDLEDWQEEGSKMATIYSHAILTIAATASSNSTGGFYRSPASNDDEILGESTAVHCFTDRAGLAYKICVKSASEFAVATERSLPLQKRAWFFQEWILSPRIVHFADTMLYWECSEVQQADDGTFVTISPDVGGGQKNTLASLTRPPPAPLNSLSKENLQALAWHGLIRVYSKLQLTYSTDIFPALQGIATRMAVERQCTFYAGLWEDSLVVDLLWRLRVPSKIDEYGYRAPSWSWASWSEEVIWMTSRWLDLAEYPQQTCIIPEVSIVSITAQTASGNPFGQVSGGTLVLRGLCLPSIIRLDRAYGTIPVPRIKISNLDDQEDLVLSRGFWSPDVRYQPEPDADILVMLIGLWPVYNEDKLVHESWFLVFERASLVGDVYRRIGILRAEKLAYRARFLREAIEQELTII